MAGSVPTLPADASTASVLLPQNLVSLAKLSGEEEEEAEEEKIMESFDSVEQGSVEKEWLKKRGGGAHNMEELKSAWGQKKREEGFL